MTPAAGTVRAGVRHDDVVRALPRNWPGTVLAILDSWDEWSGPLRALHPDALPIVPNVRFIAPVTFPRKILCAGADYYSHAEEMKTARPDPRAVPFFFMKPPTTTIAGPVASVPLPRGQAPDYDWEGELAIVIGRAGKHIAPEDAASHVAGYTVADDLSARGRFQRPNAVEPGDLILTGTPAGVGLPRDTFLAAGDVVEVEISGIGRIVHTIVAPDD